jgi:hypothetical protein
MVRRAFQVERNAALVQVERLEIQALRRLAAPEGWEAAGRRARRRLDQDHVGAEVGQDLAAELAALVGHIEHAIGRVGADAGGVRFHAADSTSRSTRTTSHVLSCTPNR